MLTEFKAISSANAFLSSKSSDAKTKSNDYSARNYAIIASVLHFLVTALSTGKVTTSTRK